MREALVFGNRPVPQENERQAAVSVQVQEIRDRQAAGLLPTDLDPGHLRLMGFALINYPRMLPQITRMTTGMSPENPSFMTRGEALLREVGSWLEEAARRKVVSNAPPTA
jgi:Tetracyclin repressor-like, C-terminal domain